MTLIACSRCHRQYDVSDFEPGARVRCTCGRLELVPSPGARQAEVIYCGDCGGKLPDVETPCEYCGARTTPAERTLGLACPECHARMARGARFCSACGVEIAPVAVLKALADTRCPRCEAPLAIAEGAPGAFHECTRCGGIWLSRRDFLAWLERLAREAPSAPPPPAAFAPHERQVLRGADRSPVRCPSCGILMLPSVYAQISGVVVDACFTHGWWFDGGELEALGEFVRRGGLEAARRRRAARARLRRRRAQRRRAEAREQADAGDLLIALLGLFTGD